MRKGWEKVSKARRGIFGRKKAFVNIQRDFYTVATLDGNEAEIVMYGEIVEERPRDWWTDEPLEGNYIVLDEFLEDLEKVVGATHITIRLNSIGGDAYAAIPIHNRLRELKAKKTVIVDGVAMSGGSLIMCAGDTVKVNASSLIMIHKCWSRIWGGYNADELRKMAESQDAVDKAQASIYRRKTGIGEEDILDMMADETYMTGSEAVEKGFADELMEGDALDIAASADLATIYVNGRALRLTNPLLNLPESVPTVKSDDKSVETNINNKPAETGGEEGGETMAKNLEELKAENPELAEQLMAEAKAAASLDEGSLNAAVEAERKRIAEIDEIASLYDDEIVEEAKYGENPCTAQELAFRAAKEAAKKGKKILDDLIDDTNTSGAGDVNASPQGDDDTKPLSPKERMAQGRADAQRIQNKEEK